jgi:hypothetical protein
MNPVRMLRPACLVALLSLAAAACSDHGAEPSSASGAFPAPVGHACATYRAPPIWVASVGGLSKVVVDGAPGVLLGDLEVGCVAGGKAKTSRGISSWNLQAEIKPGAMLGGSQYEFRLAGVQLVTPTGDIVTGSPPLVRRSFRLPDIENVPASLTITEAGSASDGVLVTVTFRFDANTCVAHPVSARDVAIDCGLVSVPAQG